MRCPGRATIDRWPGRRSGSAPALTCASGASTGPRRSDAPSACVVMGSGFSCVRDQGLDAFAERLAAAGYAALAFDYRNWGESEGEPRQLSDARRQRADWRAAIAHVRALEEIDSARIALWSYSLGTGHIQALAAEGVEVAALICVAPLLNGRSSLLHIGGPRHVAKLTGAGLRDATRAIRGADPYRIAAIGEPGSLAVINSPECDRRLRRGHAPRVELAQRGLRPRRTLASLQPGQEGEAHPVPGSLLRLRVRRRQPARARQAGRTPGPARRAP